MAWGIKEKALARLPRFPLTAESLLRTIVLFGFCASTMLIGGIGYWSRISFDKLEEEIISIHQTAANHIGLVLRIKETAGRMVTEARNMLAVEGNKILRIPAKQDLEKTRDEMEEHINEGRRTRLAESQEWKEFEAAFSEYWSRITNPQPVDWFRERDRMHEAIAKLEEFAKRERRDNIMRSEELSRAVRNRAMSMTVAAVIVGFLVAGLTFYEIRRILSRLSNAYRETAEARDYLQSLFDSLISGVVVVGQDGKVQSASDSFRKLTGLGADAIEEASYEQVLNGKAALIGSINEELGSPSKRGRYFGRAELGEGRLFDVFGSPLLIAEEARGLILVFVDITEMERAQLELRRNRALTAIGQMTAQIAHEIKNPLGSIRFAAEVLKRKSVTNGANKDTIEVIERSVDHLTAIVAELSEFARPKELNKTEVDLNNLLDGLIPMVADRLEGKSVRIERRYAQNIPMGHYDGTELRKLFLNLIINAIDASQPGSTIELRTRLDGKRAIMVDVVDTGAGMDKETLRRLFEPFYTTKKKGTGLGMAISKKIAELHRGDLSVLSKEGEGTMVTVRLPLD